MFLLILILLLVLAFRFGLLAFALYAFVLVLFVSRYLAKVWIASVAVERECNRDLAEIGDTVAIVLSIRNIGRWPIAWLLVEDLLPRHALLYRPPSLQVTGRRLMFIMLWPGESKRLMYQLRCNRRGYFQLGPTVLETGDLFGLHRRFRIETEPVFLTVLPTLVPLQGYEVSSRRPIGEVRMTHRLFEDPTRNAGIRRYEPGDPLNRVHWRATARTGELQSKVYEPSSVAGATLLLDLHVDSNPARHEPLRGDLAVTAAASIAHALYQLQQQVGLVTNGRDAADRVRTEGWTLPPRTRDATRKSVAMSEGNDRLRPVIVPTDRGAATRMRIVETLARLELTGGLTLPELILESAARLPRDATVIVILQTVDEQVAVALGTLARQGRAVTAIINTYETIDFVDAAGPLLAEGILTRHLVDETSVSTICRNLVMTGVA